MRTLKPHRINLRNTFSTLDAFIYLYRFLLSQIPFIFHNNFNLNEMQCPNCDIFQEIEASEIPETPEFITRFLPSPSNSLHASSPNDQHHGFSPTTPLLLSSLWPWCIFESTSSLRLIQHPQSGAQKLSFKFERMETFLKDSGFNSVGEFLKILFYSCLGCLEAYEILPAVSQSHSF